MKPALSHRFVSLTLVAVFTASSMGIPQLAEANLWQERRDARVAMLPAGFPELPALTSSALQSSISRASSPRIDALLAGSKQKNLRSILSALSASLGSVRDVALAANPDAPVLIHIQDIHQNYEAQKNIENLLSQLSTSNAPDFIALEGAFAPVDLADFHSFPDASSVSAVAQQMLEENKIAGPVAAGLLATKTFPPLLGVDDQLAYRANVSAYRRSLRERTNLQDRAQRLEKTLQSEKNTAFNSSLREFDQRVAAYHAKDGNLGDYAEAVAQHVASVPDCVSTFLKAVRLEKSLNFDRVEAERARLLEQLVRRMSAQDSRELMAKSAAFRQGLINHAQFYAELKELCDRIGVSLASYPAMDAYVKYVVLADTISAENILSALDQMESVAYGRLAVSPAEKQLVEKTRALSALKRLLAFELTSDEWQRYQDRRSVVMAPRRGGQLGFTSQDLSPYENFYRSAQLRDHAMARNLTALAKERHARSVVLVAGGFHSSGVKKLANEAGFSVITFAPRITKVEDESGSAYLSVFAQEKTPLEKLIAGQPLFLAREPLTSGIQMEIGVRAIGRMRVISDVITQWFTMLAEKVATIQIVRLRRTDSNHLQILGRKLSRLFEIIVSPTSVVSVTLIRPGFETVALRLLRSAIQLSVSAIMPDYAAPVTGIVTAVLLGFLFAMVHYLVDQRAGKIGWRTLMGSAYVGLFSLPENGLFESLLVHIAHNAGIITAQQRLARQPERVGRLMKWIASLPLTAIGEVPAVEPAVHSSSLKIRSSNNVEIDVLGRTFIVEGLAQQQIEGYSRVWSDADDLAPEEKKSRIDKERARMKEATGHILKLVMRERDEMHKIIPEGEERTNQEKKIGNFYSQVNFFQVRYKKIIEEKLAEGLSAAHALDAAIEAAILIAQDEKSDLRRDARERIEEEAGNARWLAVFLGKIAVAEIGPNEEDAAQSNPREALLSRVWTEITFPDETARGREGTRHRRD